MSNKNKTYNRKKVVTLFFFCAITFVLLTVRLVDLMIFQSAYYTDKAEDLHERERSIKAARGRILDRNGVVLADNKTVCTISVIHSQLEDKEENLSENVWKSTLPWSGYAAMCRKNWGMRSERRICPV